MENLIKTLQSKRFRVLVLGDLMVDKYIWGDAKRISPEAPVQVVNIHSETLRLGGACNVASNLIALGARVSVLGVIGADESGEWIKRELDSKSINTDGILTDDRPTTCKTRVMAGSHQLLRLDSEVAQPISVSLQQTLLRVVERILESSQFDSIILSDYAKGVLTASVCQGVIALARERGISVLIDPKGSDYSKYKGATLLTPNKKEAKDATGIEIKDDASLKSALLRLKDFARIPLITLSEEGMAYLESEDGRESIVRIKTNAKDVYDVTGAGDTVISALALGLGGGIEQACRFANLAASVVVGKIGSSTATLDEIANLLHLESSKILKLDALLARLNEIDGRVVFTNGCFDILHRGHVQYLKTSRELGDLLIVGLNSDSSIKKLKGEDRPVNSQMDRAFVLSALECVDYVVIFDEDTPLNLLSKIKPDVLTKGADYEIERVVGREYARRVELVPFVSGYSSSNIILKIKEDK